MTVVQAPVRSLPTLQRLVSAVGANDVQEAVAKAWFTPWAETICSKDAVAGILDLIVDDAFWCDLHSPGTSTCMKEWTLRQFLTDQLLKFDLSAFKLREYVVRDAC